MSAYTIQIDGTPVPVVAGTLDIQNQIGQRSTVLSLSGPRLGHTGVTAHR